MRGMARGLQDLPTARGGYESKGGETARGDEGGVVIVVWVDVLW
jgi:hypothetical protein